MINAALAQFWASSQHYLRSYHWACAELSVRGLTATFLMVMFLHVNARALPLNNPDVKINHFLVPALMLGVMANCAACLVDQYFGPLDKRIRYVISYVKPMWSGLCVNSCIIFDKTSLLEKNKLCRSRLVLQFLVSWFAISWYSIEKCPCDWRNELNLKLFYLIICRCEIRGTSLRLLHDAGEPMYLGFLIHVFLHFLIMQTRMGRSKRSLPGNEDTPLLHPNRTDIDGSWI